MKNIKSFILGAFFFSTIAVGSYLIQDGAISTAKLANLAVTRAKTAAVGQQTSSAINVSGLTSTSYADITNATITITTTGRPVMLFLSGPTTSTCVVTFDNASSAAANTGGAIQALRASTVIGQMTTTTSLPNTGAQQLRFDFPCSMYLWFDTPAAGTYTYKLQYKVNVASPSGGITFGMTGLLDAYEL